jgi:hypothetical protein
MWSVRLPHRLGCIVSDFQQVFNLQRLAVLTTALGMSPPDPDLIYEAMKDRMHQPYRKSLVSILGFQTVNLILCTDTGSTRGFKLGDAGNPSRPARNLPLWRRADYFGTGHRRLREDCRSCLDSF